MTPGPPRPPDEVEREVAALIESLHTTGQRLEELTAGEVDSVVDRSGRTFLLRGTQQQVHRSEVSRQATILNALPAHIAMLDASGMIVSVNKAWRRFGQSNALEDPRYGVGLNYLAICDAATGGRCAEAREVAAGIRAVLEGSAASYSVEYPCHAPGEERWFILTVAPLVTSRSGGAVVMHVDISERVRGEEELRRFESAMDATADGIYMVDRASMQYLHMNKTALTMLGLSREEVIALGPHGVLLTTRAQLEREFDEVIARGTDAQPQELLRTRADGSQVWIELRRHAKRWRERWTIVSIARDITDRKLVQDRIRRLNRVLSVMSKVSDLIVRVRERETLYDEACRIAVDAGGFRMALIGIVEPASMRLDPIAMAGKDDELQSLVRDVLTSGKRAQGTLIASAIREKLAMVSNDSRNDPRVLFGGRYAESGVHAIAVLPLLVDGKAAGVLALYADEAGFFDRTEMNLLGELAGNVAFAIDHIDKQERLDYLAYYDALTGLANRSLFVERVAQYTRSAAAGGHGLALFMIDLQHFKNINDSLGRAAGDALLRLVAEWLVRTAGSAGLVGRLGGDDFAVVLPHVKHDGGPTRLLEKRIAAFLAHPFRLDDAVLRIAVRVGVALYPADGTDADTLFRNAEAALKRAKAGGDRYLFYTPSMTSAVAGNLTMENQLRMALEREEFVLHYQPKVRLATGTVSGAEALIRWNDPRTGLVPPGRFIPILEETGLIQEVGRWALGRAIADFLRWRAAGHAPGRVAVNVSPLQLRNPCFTAELARSIAIPPGAAAGLEIEITESVIMEDVKSSIAVLREIRELGVTVAIDDFGTGFSSLSYLARLPVDTLKIDRSFVVDMTGEPEGLALVSTIINLGHSMNLNVVAEGVETEEQSRLLRLLKCDEMQGFLYSRPVPADEFEARFLAKPPA